MVAWANVMVAGTCSGRASSCQAGCKEGYRQEPVQVRASRTLPPTYFLQVGPIS
jgi:hypothetical protein